MEISDPVRAKELAQGLLFALDPGLRYPAGALFWQGRLQIAERIKVPTKLAKLSIGERTRQIADLIVEWYFSKVTTKQAPDAIVYEWPFVYPGKTDKDPNDLIPLAAMDAAVAARLQPRIIVSPLPREWAGGTKKTTTGDPWLSQRGQIVGRRLDVAGVGERALVVTSHDAIDAAGLGLWALGRLDRAVFPGAV